jgi:catechol 2,3-dioxygenase-like lactoylglutathione lyase family enzyme
MINYQDLFHTGIRVSDLEAAMEDIGESLGVTWAAVRETEQQVWTPDDGAQQIPLRFVYSREGPQHIELLEGAPGSVWDGRARPGAHHVGVWVDDVAAETERLCALGWSLVAAQQSPADGYGVFTYVQPPSGLIVEPVDRRVLAHFEAWWAAE